MLMLGRINRAFLPDWARAQDVRAVVDLEGGYGVEFISLSSGR